MEELVGKNVKNSNFEDYDFEKLNESNIIGLYFYASFCPVCRNFTKLLIEFYNEINRDKHKMEIVLIPLDNEEEEFKKHINKMPWATLPFNDSKIKEIVAKYSITSIPKLLIFNNQGKKISMEGRKEIGIKGYSAFNLWLQTSPLDDNLENTI